MIPTSRYVRLRLVRLPSLLLVTALLPADARAGIVSVGRDSGVMVQGQGNAPFVDGRTFDQLGTYNDSLVLGEGDAPRGKASQNTTINYSTDVGQLTGSGSVSADAFAQLNSGATGYPQAEAISWINVYFHVIGNNEPFSASGAFDKRGIGEGASIRVIDTADQSGLESIFFAAETMSDEAFSSGTISLPVGSYVLTAQAYEGADENVPALSTSLTFEFTVGSGIAPPPPGSVVPLPAGVWAGLIGLTTVAGAMRKRAWCHRHSWR